MASRFSVVVPVKDGARYLAELIAAVRAQGVDELLVIDSGSSDGSVELARDAGAGLLEIAPEEFGHGRTRNLGVEHTTGDIVAFLTQDATPLPGWVDALREGFALDERVGAVYGPHRARSDTSPMIARELEEFFARHTGPDGGPAIQRAGDDSYLSNVNAAYRRDCWAALRFPDIRYSEDMAFGRAMLDAGWLKVYAPGAAVLHAHDYPPVDFMRRYFDEYRGLRETIGHVEGFGVRTSLRDVRALVGADRRWMRVRGLSASERARWTGRSIVHHGGRKVFSALGSRAHRLPDGVQRTISLEGTAGGTPADPPPGPPPAILHEKIVAGVYEDIRRVAVDGPAPLLDPVPGMADRPLHLAFVIPHFRRGSGGHNSIFQIASRLERMGHTVTIWIHDPMGYQRSEWEAVAAQDIREWFAPLRGAVYKGFDRWYGADVAVATGWQTVHPVLRLADTRARAYLVHDHESQFYATSAEAYWAEETYSLGLHAVCSSPWLANIVRERHGGSTSLFDFGVDHDVYQPKSIARRRDTVIFYARDITPRRAVPLGMLALQELHARRPGLRIVLFGDIEPADAPFPYEHLGVASPDQLAWAYSQATVGLCLSMTNYSLIPQEMLACGLPCVDLAGFCSETVFGADGPVELAPFEPVALADAIERLLDNEAAWTRASAAGLEFVAARTWDRAAEQVDAGLRTAVRLRESGAPTAIGQARPGALGATTLATAQSRGVDVEWVDTAPASERLLARLSADDRAELERLARTSEFGGSLWESASPVAQKEIALSLGVWHGLPALREKIGLVRDAPPEDVHAMGRGPLAAGGSFYDADMIAGALARVGIDVQDVGRALDFGCSSGRAARALSAAYPEVEWHGVDPNAAAIAWASEHLPAIHFAVSPTDPPLAFADASFDLVYAISIWSHFDEPAAHAWLAELRRVLKPGGRLLLTTHGYQSVQFYGEHGLRPARQLQQIREALYRHGFWFAPEFGEKGDYGVVHGEWGTAFLSPEWLLRAATPDWEVEVFAVGLNAGNQDVYVLRRRA